MNLRGEVAMDKIVRIRVSKQQRQLIQKYSARKGLTISEALRQIIEQHVRRKKLERNSQ